MKILYICTHNRCRSILSEAITNTLGDGIIEAKSAGSQPAGEVHPLSLRYLQRTGYPVDGLVSESWDLHEAFQPDLVVTVCDSAARESCPIYFGKSIKIHWGLSDPSKIEGTDMEKGAAFNACIKEIETRVKTLIQLANKDLTKDQFATELRSLGAR